MKQRIKTQYILLACVVTVFTAAIAIYSKAYTEPDIAVKNAPKLTHSQFEAQQNALIQLVEKQDPAASFEHLKDKIGHDPAVARACHPLLHMVGHAAYEKYKSFQESISYQDGLCNSGYTHGLIEAHFMASKNINDTIRSTCPESSDFTFDQWQCFHGTGHGAMLYTGKNVNESLALCEKLPTRTATQACANGVFMERFIIISHSGHHIPSSKVVDAGICWEQQERYKADCYIYASTATLELNNNDYEAAFRECVSVEANHKKTCVSGIGSQAMKTNIADPKIAHDVCAGMPRSYKNACVAGAIGLFINHHGGSKEPAQKLCATVFSDFEDTCMGVAG